MIVQKGQNEELQDGELQVVIRINILSLFPLYEIVCKIYQIIQQ